MRFSTRTTGSTGAHDGWQRRLVSLVVTALALATTGVLTAAPAAAVSPGSGPLTGGIETVAGTVTGVTGGTATYDNTVAGTTTITVSAPRTIIGLSGLDLAATETLNLVVNSATDVVQLRTASGVATIDGILQSRLTSGVLGGNVWTFATGGVTFNPNAQVDVGGLVASSATITDADFLDGNADFSLSNAFGNVLVQGPGSGGGPGAVIRGHGSLVAVISSFVLSGQQARFEAAPGTRTEVFFGSAVNASMTLAPRGEGMDLVSFQPSGSRSGGVTVWGPVAAADVFMAANPAGRTDTYTASLHNATAHGAPASGDGDVVVSAGGGLSRSSATAPMRPVLDATAPANIAGPSDAITAARSIVFSGSDRVEPGFTTRLSAPAVVVRSGGIFRNFAGRSLIDTAVNQQWVVYAPNPGTVEHPYKDLPAYGTLDSGQRAVWGGTLESRPPSSVTGNRYVFSDPPDVTVTALNTSKNFDVAFAAGQPHPLQATVTGEPHPGIPGVFLADAGPAFVGAPTLTSDGRPHTAPERPGGYPIIASAGPPGEFYSPLGYDLVFVNGRLTVDDTSAPVVTPDITGTLGSNGWYRSIVGLTWSIVDPGTIASSISGLGCGPVSITTDQAMTAYTCTGTSMGGSAAPVTVTIGRDATAPTLTATSSVGGTPLAAGTWTSSDVRVDYVCSDATSGVAPGSPSPDVDPVTATQTLTGSCTDNAGNTATVQHQVNIDTVLPTVEDETLRTVPGGATYVPGTWTNQAVELAWDCADTGGSGVAAGSRTATATSSGTLQALCRDGAGNERSGQPFAVSIDAVAPTAALTVTNGDGTPYTSGTWTRQAVTVAVACTDTGGSGVLSAGSSTTLSESGSVTLSCSDLAGNTTPAPTVEVRVDDTAPAIGAVSLTTADGSAYTSGGWTTQAVTLTWTCTDGPGGSGSVASSGSSTATSTGTLRAVCTDAAGNRAEGDLVQANIDAVAPVLAGVPANLSATTTGTVATVTWLAPTASDDQDGTVDVACTPASGSSFPVGATTVTCTATDDAGNTDTETFTVNVTQLLPTATVVFDKPIDSAPVMNIAKLGRAIAVRATVTSQGVPVTGSTTQPVHLSVTSGVSCSVASTADAIENYAAGSSGTGNLMTWDASAQRWTFLLDTGAFAMKANACYRVSVHYGGTVTGGTASGGTLAGYFYVQTKK